GSRPPERAQVRDDRRGLADLLHGVAQLADDLPLLRDGELDQVDGIADEQPDVVEWIVELVGDAGGQLTDGGELSPIGRRIRPSSPAQPDHPSLMGAQDRAGCCGTMQLGEYARDQKRLDADLERLSEEGEIIPEAELLAEEV